MRIRESFRIGWRAVTAHKLRSSLTTLGIVIGIASVIVFMVMGGALIADAEADVDTDAEPQLSVQTQTDADGGFGWQIDTTPIYTERDVEQLESVEGVEYVAPDGWLSAVQIGSEDTHITGELNVRGTIAEHVENTGDSIEGEAFSGPDEAVLNEEALEALDPAAGIGETITVTFEDGTRTNFTVTGVVDDGSSGWNAQPTAYVPVDPHYQITVETPQGDQQEAYPFLTIRAESDEVLDDVQDSAQAYLDTESDAAQLKQEDYEIRALTLSDQVERFEEVIDQATIFVAAVAGISLIVGAIGIANIMIVSVAERTREIGIMKAVGATHRDVMKLFLAESLILGVIGGVFGILGGLGIGYLAVTLAGWPMVYPLGWIVVAVSMGILAGVVSGLYPAWRAARVDPVRALRAE